MDIVTWIYLFAFIVSSTQSAKVLLIPMNVGSHILYFGQVASALADEGHEATLYVPSNNKPPEGLSGKVNVIVYKVPHDIPYGNSAEWAKTEVDLLNSQSTWDWIEQIVEQQVQLLTHCDEDCESLFAPDVYGPLSSAGFQIAIVDPVMFSCLYAIPYKLNIPYISLSIPFAMWGYRVGHLSSLWPNLITTSGEKMDFWDRLWAFETDALDYVFTNTTDYFVRKYVPEKPVVTAGDLLFNSSMWWYLYDLSVGYPKATMPNTLDIGDIMVRPAKPLGHEFLDIMQAAKYGVIYVSLGSHFDAVPEAWLKEFCDAFNALKYSVIWKLKVKPPCELGPNVHIRPWLPQNDLLAHPKLVLFITHAGYNSLLESVSHGKPMLALPISLDQPYNAQLLVDKGLGEFLDIKSFKAQELIEAVERILAPPATYSHNARRTAQLLRRKSETPAARVSFWVDHVLEFGTSHMTSAALDLNIFQFLMLDIYAFLLVVAIAVVVVVLLLLYCVYRCLRKVCRRLCSRSNKVHKD